MTGTPYAHAVVAVALWALLVLALSLLSTLGQARARCDCGKPKRDYSDPVYRRDRAFQNALETSAPFLAATLAAVVSGASPFWVNLLASVFLVSRLAMAGVHIGTENQPLRSACYLVGWLCVIGLAIFAIGSVFTG